jgi:hypothetical protein
MMRPGIRELVAKIRASAARRWVRVSGLRHQTRAALAMSRARRHQRSARRVVPAAPDDGGWLEEAVLRVIANCPDGVRAVDIGNAVGVDWRRVPAVAHRLVERGMVDVIEDRFYPVAKAS